MTVPVWMVIVTAVGVLLGGGGTTTALQRKLNTYDLG